MRLTFAVLLSLPLAVLTACGGDASPEDDGRSATGEVLEGTISDDMLPLATLRSQPPLLPPEEQDADPGTGPSAAPSSTPGAETMPRTAASSSPSPAQSDDTAGAEAD